MALAFELNHIHKYFPNVKANDDITLAVEKGEIHAIVGENGAGKTTLMNILYGLYQPDSGEIKINGEKKVFHSPLDAIKNGLGMVHQNFMLFSKLSVWENIVYGAEPMKLGFLDKNTARNTVIALSKQYNLEIDPDAKVGDLPVGVRQRVEILKALYRKAEILIFDEPTAVLTPQEQTVFFEVLRNLASNGKTIIFITHKLNEVMAISDRITVLRSGKVTAQLKTAETSIHEISRHMVGHDLTFNIIKDECSIGDVILSVKNLNVFDKENFHVLKNISFDVHEGEIVGIAGVAGNGQDELIRVITGLSSVNYIFGNILLNAADITFLSNHFRRETGLSYIPEDRTEVESALKASVAENILIGYLNNSQIVHNGIISETQLTIFCQKLVTKYQVKTSDLHEAAANLSGGNLQKLIISREMNHSSKLLIAEQPTRGVDIGGIEFIHKNILEQRSQRNGVLLVSTELSEILALSDRIIVFYEGKIIGEVNGDQADENMIGMMMAGVIPQNS